MKKLIIVLISSVFAFSAFAGGDLFSYDKQKVDQTFASVDQLEQYLVLHQGYTLSDVLSGDQQLLAGMDLNVLSSAGPMAAAWSIEDMDWGSFAWGFCCWPVGFFVVAINGEKTNDQKLSYWIGLATGAVLGLVSTVTGVFSSVVTY